MKRTQYLEQEILGVYENCISCSVKNSIFLSCSWKDQPIQQEDGTGQKTQTCFDDDDIVFYKIDIIST
jgi:hypothetical protein